MKALPPLTAEQRRVASRPDHLLAVEAGPGTGKTVTAAERFGHLAYRNKGEARGVVVLSFTVGATTVVRTAIRRRWGHDALSWPNECRTFDSVFRSILNHLLRTESLHWPGHSMSLRVIDEWRDLRAAEYRNPTAWLPALKGDVVECSKHRVDAGDYVVTAKKRLLPQLEDGYCTHDSVRDIVMQAAQDNPELRSLIVGYLSQKSSAVLVDEAFDANATDVALLELFLESGCSLSLIGDPWQALYGFREAHPDLVQKRGSSDFRWVEGRE